VQPAIDDWRDGAADDLLDAIVGLDTRDEAAAFLRDLCTLGELQAMKQRWHVVRLLAQGLHYSEISTLTGASTGTVTRVAAWLRHGTGGYRLALERLGARTAGGDDSAHAAGVGTTAPARTVGAADATLGGPTLGDARPGKAT
jgi:TrpR-related protein YerC/YecD